MKEGKKKKVLRASCLPSRPRFPIRGFRTPDVRDSILSLTRTRCNPYHHHAWRTNLKACLCYRQPRWRLVNKFMLSLFPVFRPKNVMKKRREGIIAISLKSFLLSRISGDWCKGNRFQRRKKGKEKNVKGYMEAYKVLVAFFFPRKVSTGGLQALEGVKKKGRKEGGGHAI